MTVLVAECDRLVVQCGRFGLWSFWLWPFWFVAILVCGRFGGGCFGLWRHSDQRPLQLSAAMS